MAHRKIVRESHGTKDSLFLGISLSAAGLGMGYMVFDRILEEGLQGVWFLFLVGASLLMLIGVGILYYRRSFTINSGEDSVEVRIRSILGSHALQYRLRDVVSVELLVRIVHIRHFQYHGKSTTYEVWLNLKDRDKGVKLYSTGSARKGRAKAIKFAELLSLPYIESVWENGERITFPVEVTTPLVTRLPKHPMKKVTCPPEGIVVKMQPDYLRAKVGRHWTIRDFLIGVLGVAILVSTGLGIRFERVWEQPYGIYIIIGWGVAMLIVIQQLLPMFFPWKEYMIIDDGRLERRKKWPLLKRTDRVSLRDIIYAGIEKQRGTEGKLHVITRQQRITFGPGLKHEDLVWLHESLLTALVSEAIEDSQEGMSC